MTGRPRPHPDPPAGFDSVELPTSRRSRRWFRAHRCRCKPVFFGTTRSSRFDDPNGEFGVLYLAAEFEGAFVEGCLVDSGLGTTGPLLSEKMLKARCLAEIRFARPITLVDLRGSGLAAIGADARLSSGDYRIAQRWSRAIWRHPSLPDGILYLSRHNQQLLCAAVFDRAPETIVKQLGSFLGSGLKADTAALLDRYGVGLC